MTWFSQLFSKGRNVQRRTRPDHRGLIQSGKGRRRIMIVESLERRVVLSNVTTALSPTGVLTITGDIHNDSFSITENAGGIVTVAQTAAQTTINLTRKPYTSPSKVTSIVVILPGTANYDNVAFKGQGKTTASTIGSVSFTATGANLIFTANGVDNSAPLTLSNTVGLPGGNDATLHANVDNSTFTSIAITQTGNAPAFVELGNDSTSAGSSPGPVAVSEGVANDDTVILDKLAGGGDSFGSTTLTQGAGPAFTGANGNADSVSASNAQVGDLTIDQLLAGNAFHHHKHRKRRSGQLRRRDVAGRRQCR
jgi:hypothetical protein